MLMLTLLYFIVVLSHIILVRELKISSLRRLFSIVYFRESIYNTKNIWKHTTEITWWNCHVLLSISPDILYSANLIRVQVMLFNVTFNNIAVLSSRSVLLVGKTGVPGENHRPAASQWQYLPHNVAYNFIRKYVEMYTKNVLKVFVVRAYNLILPSHFLIECISIAINLNIKSIFHPNCSIHHQITLKASIITKKYQTFK